MSAVTSALLIFNEKKYGMTKLQFDKEFSLYQGVWKVERDPETGKLNGQRYFSR